MSDDEGEYFNPWKDEYRPWNTFLQEAWHAETDSASGLTFLERRKKIANVWKNMKESERKTFDRKSTVKEMLYPEEMMGPDEPKISQTAGVYRTFYGDPGGGGETQETWWENAKHLVAFDFSGLCSPYVDEYYEEDSWTVYSEPSMLDGVTPETFLQRVFADRYDFGQVAYDVEGKPKHLGYRKGMMADEIAAKTGIMLCFAVHEGDGEIDYIVRLPAERGGEIRKMDTAMGWSMADIFSEWNFEEGMENDPEQTVDLRQPLLDATMGAIKRAIVFDEGDEELKTQAESTIKWARELVVKAEKYCKEKEYY